MDSHASLCARRTPRRVSQDPRCFCRRAPSPAAPGSPMSAYARCFPIGDRLQHLRKTSRLPVGVTRPNRVRERWARVFALATVPRRSPIGRCRWTDPFRALGCPPAPDRSYMWNEQFTWLTPLSQQDTSGLTWFNRSHEEDIESFFQSSCLRVCFRRSGSGSPTDGATQRHEICAKKQDSTG